MTKFDLALKTIRDCTIHTEYLHKVYLVGGCVRDKLLDISIKDVDIMVDMPNGGIKLATYLTETFSDVFSNMVIFERFGTAKITFMDKTDNMCDIEFVAPRTEVYESDSRKPINVEYCDLKTDALRRDFTVNALYVNIHTQELVDLVGGEKDLAHSLLDTPTDPQLTFYDDPLRMLRAIRFAVQKNFILSDRVIDAIKSNAYRLSSSDNAIKSPISKERIQDELVKMIMTPRAVDAIKMLYEFGCLKYITTDQHLHNMFGFDQRNEHHNETLDNHILSVLNGVIIAGNATLEVRLAALLHDIGKLDCYELKEDGVHYRYHGHEFVSGDIAYNILKELKFSNEVCDSVKFMVERHMLLKQFNDDSGHLKITKKSARKVVRKCGDYLYDILKIMDADNKAHAEEASNRLWYQIDDFRELIPTLWTDDIQSGDIKNKIKIPVNGNDIMECFNITPGPMVKRYLEVATDIFDEHPEYNKEDILKELKNKV
jgi:tRNA nucleotidyltransferase/poly(A) polymerase